MTVKEIEKKLEDLQEKLLELCLEVGTREFARKVCLSETDVSSWKSGKRIYSYEKLLKIAKILKV